MRTFLFFNFSESSLAVLTNYSHSEELAHGYHTSYLFLHPLTLFFLSPSLGLLPICKRSITSISVIHPSLLNDF